MKTLLLPGMGADSRMYPGNSYAKLSHVTYGEWPEYSGETTIEEVAETVIATYTINRDTIVGGSSLGGMVALQIAKNLNLKKVILIGSATGPGFVNPVLKRLSHMTDLAPIKLIQMLAGMFSTTGNSDVVAMFEDADSDFINAMCKGIFTWKGIGSYSGDICQIHGSDDKVIYPPESQAKLIEGGGHLLSMTHKDTVAEFIREQIKDNEVS